MKSESKGINNELSKLNIKEIIGFGTSIYDCRRSTELVTIFFSEGHDVIEAQKFLMYVDYSRMKICSICYTVYGFWKMQNISNDNLAHFLAYQNCGCHSTNIFENFSNKIDKAELEEFQRNDPLVKFGTFIDPTGENKKNQIFDFNEIVTICYCCGKEVIKSGSRWSVWFCDECKEKVIHFNTQFQETIIPIGRHSIMAGYKLEGPEILSQEKIKSFTFNIKNLSSRIDIMFDWKKKVMAENFELLGYSTDVSLMLYLKEVKERGPSKLSYFNSLMNYFYQSLQSQA